MVTKAGVRAEPQAPSPEPQAPPSFEDAIDELESIVQRMESGALSLEDSLAAYRRGAELAAFCRKALSAVEQQVRLLEGDLLRPFDSEAGSGQ